MKIDVYTKVILTGIFLCLSLIVWSAALSADESPQHGRPPNIVLIMSDDMGYSDIGCYGGEIQTPNLDRLAANGLRFTQFYNTARCCPTRACLLTGLYPHQTGVGYMMRDRGVDGYRGDLNRNCMTIAEVLKPVGYSTYMTGKWHVRAKAEAAHAKWQAKQLQASRDRAEVPAPQKTGAKP